MRQAADRWLRRDYDCAETGRPDLARAGQWALAEAAGLSGSTIQRMEASEGVIRAHVDSLMKVISALDAAGIELINEGAVGHSGGRGVRLKMR